MKLANERRVLHTNRYSLHSSTFLKHISGNKCSDRSRSVLWKNFETTLFGPETLVWTSSGIFLKPLTDYFVTSSCLPPAADLLVASSPLLEARSLLLDAAQRPVNVAPTANVARPVLVLANVVPTASVILANAAKA